MYPNGMHAGVFTGGHEGQWRVTRLEAVRGEPLPQVTHVAVNDDSAAAGVWTLRGVASHVRYVERREKAALDPVSPTLGRPDATRAALIPIRKSPDWWALPQDERRAIFEGRSRHIADSLPYLPRVARRLYHARELAQPFDFLTWFEYAPEHQQAFEDLVGMLRSREEWSFVDREIDIRLER